MSTSAVNIRKRNNISLKKKMIVQLLICTVIYGGIFFVKNKENYFSNLVIKNVSNILSYDINLMDAYNGCVSVFNNRFINSNNTINEENVINENINVNNQNIQDEEINQDIIDGNSENSIEEENVLTNETENQNKSQMELDAEYIKQNYNMIIPVRGKITSGYGEREPTEIISAFHQGVDISSAEGTEIHSAMDGTVIAASYAGDYGNHVKIQNGDIITVYAHCSELNVNVGDNITQNQLIGKVGTTRKSNRTSFTF